VGASIRAGVLLVFLFVEHAFVVVEVVLLIHWLDLSLLLRLLDVIDMLNDC
jgi:hypothetical protein